MKRIAILITVILFVVVSCKRDMPSDSSEPAVMADVSQNEANFRKTLQKHLDAVTNRNLDSLKSTMSPDGKMQLILPGSEIIKSVDSFIDFHKEWFQDTTWTFKTEILSTDIGDRIGTAVTEIRYEEPLREGGPYYNRMIVTYGLEKLDGNWYVIQDHASSIEKSTDPKQ